MIIKVKEQRVKTRQHASSSLSVVSSDEAAEEVTTRIIEGGQIRMILVLAFHFTLFLSLSLCA